MTWGELLTRASVWLSLGGYAIGVVTLLVARGRTSWLGFARNAWTLGCLAMLVHLAFAFNFYHGWSHAAAFRETARQTEEVVGLNWGCGLYVNYAFVTLWILDAAAWWWLGLAGYRRRSRLLTGAWQAIFLFMIFNATVVFGTGLLRWLGVGFCIGLLILWWRNKDGGERVTLAR